MTDFDGPGAARASDPHTSWEAALSFVDGKKKDRKDVLLLHYMNPQGLTDFDLAAILERQQTSVGKRRGELRDMGLIKSTHLTRPAPSGASAIVWQITDLGKAIAFELWNKK